MKPFSLLFLMFSFSPVFLFSQKNIDPTFETFKGTAYEIPKKEGFGMKYHPKFEKYPVITTFEWNEINIPETDDSILFPDVNKRYGFALILTSTVHIITEGWYKFSLNSDDGSLLWIDKKLVVNNDGTHQMQFKEDSIALAPGNYPIKIWYFQGFPDRYGFQLNASFYRKLNPTESLTPLEKKSKKEKNIKLVISNQVLNFDHNSYRLDGKAKLFLDDFCKKTLAKVDPEKIKLIKISGHTDNSGSENYNAQLSLQRAESLANELKKRILSDEIKYELKGLGESQPIASNNTQKGKLENRRVVLEIIFKEN
ncbi:MAG: OmpA family protein [Saprospiraceae bacterium]